MSVMSIVNNDHIFFFFISFETVGIFVCFDDIVVDLTVVLIVGIGSLLTTIEEFIFRRVVVGNFLLRLGVS